MTERLLRFLSPRLLTIVALICLCGVAVAPLLRGASPCTHDGGLHYYRTVALRSIVERGTLFARWLPGVAFGYGFPFFNYRAPLSYYLGLGFHAVGLALPLALNLVYAVSIVGSALGAYLLGRDLFGAHAGALAAVTYAYAPYQLLDALVRGNAPESVALALMPFVLWAFRRLVLEGGRGWFLGSIALLAGLYLTHNISSLLFTPLLLAYLAVLWIAHRRDGYWRRVLLALGLALALTAFFWLPALAEQDYVQLYLTGATRNNDFHHNFLRLGEVFAVPRPFDPSLMNPPLEVRLGVAHAVLAGIGLIVGLTRRRRRREASLDSSDREVPSDGPSHGGAGREQRATLVFLAAAVVLLVFMSTRASVWLWEHVPLLPFVQFPWRFVGRASLPVALLAGAAVSPLGQADRPDRRRLWGAEVPALALALPIMAAVVILVSFPATYPPQGYCPMASHPSMADLHRFEHETGLVGVDPVGAYFPAWVEQRPQGSPLEAQYERGETVARFDASSLPERAQVLQADYGANRARITVESPTSFRGRYLSFYFPGWRVWVDGEPVKVTSSGPGGLISFPVPSGRHTISIRFGETPLRLGADLLSMFALLGLLTSMVLGTTSGHSPSSQAVAAASPMNRGTAGGLVLVATALIAFKLGVVDRTSTPFRHTSLRPGGALPRVEHTLEQPYGDGLELIGYDQGAQTVPADGILRFDLYWTVRRQPAASYQTVLHLVGPDGLRWSRPDSFRPTDFQDPPPTSAWTPGRFALDSQEIEPLPGTPPGRYDVVLTVFDRETLAPLSWLDERGRPAAPDLSLGDVEVTAPQDTAEPEELGVQHRLDAELGPLVLVGANLDRDQAAPGDPVLVTTFWSARDRPEDVFDLHLRLVASDGTLAAQYMRSPAASWHPTSEWQSGDVWRGKSLLHLPADLDTGTYTWRLSLVPSVAPSLSLSQISITAPDRTFAVPPLDIKTDVRLGDVATLVGADLEPHTRDLGAGATVTVTLVWRAEAATDVSYRVFLHLIGPEGAITAQSDGFPAAWARPTTSWLPGEIITDARTISIPSDARAGDHTLYAGLYTTEAGRLLTPNGADRVPVVQLEIEGRE